MSQHWTLDDIDWQAFDAAKVDADLLRTVKAASLVEANAPDYVSYLSVVFADDPAMLDELERWGAEEEQHGAALARWAELADPGFSFDKALKEFQDGYSIPQDVEESTRGSRGGELLARCVVETGTSSFYSAIRDASDEPVLKEIAGRLARDEFNHYKLFYDHFQRYETDVPSKLRRLKIALGRVSEADDDELSYAYYCANRPNADYDREGCAKAYQARALGLYQRRHTDRLVAMIANACGIRIGPRVAKPLTSVVWWGFSTHAKRLADAA
ncbi:ferritin-like domain-containing protein [Pyruvatibacter mobilis]|jgi:rubrerythrin|uniref:Ferritin-like domain-containing protein n=1 Tax=Pyruvatibacter mobilis TaxID=1712261 RepID=A0A845Q7Q2_9HYPH|nr:ferritin-like domain-containing protein [Pyruvatibacter mobilis]NBG94288.1 ferritin-like domain-containing protein [Pyruvatibacter mobilis]QJD76587.1 ferritin-like domain-containing protein [Pyruvatibacter mobilis]GGD01719.1 hypothetical protein GCM10011587_01830 [Pyruvatibacter mobilis]